LSLSAEQIIPELEMGAAITGMKAPKYVLIASFKLTRKYLFQLQTEPTAIQPSNTSKKRVNFLNCNAKFFQHLDRPRPCKCFHRTKYKWCWNSFCKLQLNQFNKESEFKARPQGLEPPTNIDFNYSAIGFWEQFPNKELQEAAMNLLQVVPTVVYSNQLLKQALLHWISNQSEDSPNPINDVDLPTIERNIFVHLNQRFLS
jgi:hypothetical protein